MAWARGNGRNDAMWVVAVALAAIAIAAYVAMPASLAQSGLYAGVGLAAAGAMVAGARLHGTPHPLPWMLLAAGTLLAVAGDLMWTVHDATAGGDPPFPWYADGVYLLSYPFFAAGLLALVRTRAPGRDGDALLDALIVAVSAGSLSWVFLITPLLRDESLGLPARIVAVTYPAADLVLLGVAARFIAAGGFRNPALLMLAGSAAALLLSDTWYGAAALNDTYRSGDPVDGGWLLAYALNGIAALHPSMRNAGKPSAAVPADRVSLRRLTLFGVVALAGPALLTVRHLRGETGDVPAIAAASAGLFLLALLRVGGLAVRLNDALMEQARVQERLRASEERFRGAFAGAPIGMALVSGGGRWRRVNRALRAMLGYTEEELVATPWSAVSHPEDASWMVQQARLEAGEIETYEVEQRFIHKDGSIVRAVISSSLVRNDAGEPVEAVCQIQDVTATRAMEEELRRLALHDPLTGLPNRTLFEDRLEQALSRARDPLGLAVLFIDLDRFKLVNDAMGHAAGDQLLREVATRLAGRLRAGDTIARVGGDEFIVLLEGLGDPGEATIAANRLLTALTEPFDISGRETFTGGSIGIATGWPGQSQAADLVRHADLALYRAKAAGRSRYVVYTAGMQDESARRLELESDLRHAVERDELRLHYQPVVDLVTQRATGAAALVHWAHPTEGLLPPDRFIGLAEESGLIVPTGRWALGEACRQAAAWQSWATGDSPFVVSVAVSARQLREPGFVRDVGEALRSSGLAPGALQLEVPEQCLLDAEMAAGRILPRLTGLGVRLAIGDFGTGYSSLEHLRRLQISALKIDRSLTEAVEDDEGSNILEAMVRLARAVGLHVTAEGVETGAQLSYLTGLGCNRGLGRLLGGPMTAGEFVATLAAAADHSHPEPEARTDQRRSGRPAPAGTGQLPARPLLPRPNVGA